MRHDDLSVGLETTQASVIVRRSAQKSSTMRGSQAQLPLDSGKTRLNDVNTYDFSTMFQGDVLETHVSFPFPRPPRTISSPSAISFRRRRVL